jgi:hypothetical protein
MGSCEPGQGLTSAAISGYPFVRGVSHRAPRALDSGGFRPPSSFLGGYKPPLR